MKTVRILLLAAWFALPAFAGAPDWFKQAAAQQLPSYPAETNAVVLLDEGKTVVKDSGEIHGYYKMMYKILRAQGRSVAKQVFCYDDETKITYLKGWTITAQGVEYEAKQKDGVESQIGDGEMYSDDRCIELTLPGADVGSVVGFEFERKQRPFILQDSWSFVDRYPVRSSRLVLQLPSNWEHKIYWINHAPVAPQDLGGGQMAFELRDLPAIETEPSMPAMSAVGAGMEIHFFPPNGTQQGTWEQIGEWEAGLVADRKAPTPAMQQKVAELTAGLASPLEKIRALARYVQHDIRYVAIEIGIGGYQPHAAGEVFSNRYGDCKDKANLLSTMLRVAGVESNLVLVNTTRGIIQPENPSTHFNHAILAIHLPSVSAPDLQAVSDVPGAGRVLFFDPTWETTPFGSLPSGEQANYGLVVTDKGGALVKMPLLPPEHNRLDRWMTLTVTAEGGIIGKVKEVRTGAEAADLRFRYLRLDSSQRKKSLENFLGGFLPSADVTSFDLQGLEQVNQPLTLDYSFTARNYAKAVGNLLLVRPRVLGEKAEDTFEGTNQKERRYPVEFDNLELQTDHVEIKLPPGYVPDEVPDPVKLDAGAVSYSSKVEVKDNVVRYDREYRVNDVYIGTEHLQDLKKFYRQLAGEEQNAVVFKRQ